MPSVYELRLSLVMERLQAAMTRSWASFSQCGAFVVATVFLHKVSTCTEARSNELLLDFIPPSGG